MDNVSRTRRAFLRGSLAFGALAFLEPAVGWAAKWIKLASRTARLGSGTTVIPVTFVAGAFSHIKLGVTDGSISVTGVQVRFSNSETVTLPFHGRIRSGGQSRPIPLPGGHRYISFVRINHRTVPKQRKLPMIDLWGER